MESSLPAEIEAFGWAESMLCHCIYQKLWIELQRFDRHNKKTACLTKIFDKAERNFYSTKKKILIHDILRIYRKTKRQLLIL